MSTLVAIAYPDRETAEKVRQELVQATKEHLVQLQDAVVAVHEPDGKVKLPGHEPGGRRRRRRSALGRPDRAALPGPAARDGGWRGRGSGRRRDGGRRRGRQVHEGAWREDAAGGAALIALGQTDARDKLLERIQPYGGHVIQTSLSNEEEERLRSALEGTAA